MLWCHVFTGLVGRIYNLYCRLGVLFMVLQVSVDLNNRVCYLVNVKENFKSLTHILFEYNIKLFRRYLTLMFSVHFERDLLIYIMSQGSHNLRSIIYASHIWVSYCTHIHELIIFLKRCT